MTDEERVLYMEQKMLLEAEAKKKKEELLNELLKVIIPHWSLILQNYNLNLNYLYFV